jgi:hypothetical protein
MGLESLFFNDFSGRGPYNDAAQSKCGQSNTLNRHPPAFGCGRKRDAKFAKYGDIRIGTKS